MVTCSVIKHSFRKFLLLDFFRTNFSSPSLLSNPTHPILLKPPRCYITTSNRKYFIELCDPSPHADYVQQATGQRGLVGVGGGALWYNKNYYDLVIFFLVLCAWRHEYEVEHQLHSVAFSICQFRVRWPSLLITTAVLNLQVPWLPGSLWRNFSGGQWMEGKRRVHLAIEALARYGVPHLTWPAGPLNCDVNSSTPDRLPAPSSKRRQVSTSTMSD